MTHLQHTPQDTPVAGFQPRHTHAEILARTRETVAAYESATGRHVCAASVAGSVARGTDVEGSDFDFIFILAGTGHRSHAWTSPRGDDVAVYGVDTYLTLLTTSVPLAEFSRSVYLLTDSTWGVVVRHARAGAGVFGSHGQGFLYHQGSKHTPEAKRLRRQRSVEHFLTTGRATCPRYLVGEG